jgi:predicted metal-dependent RNase
MLGLKVPVKATVEQLTCLSGHADWSQILEWLDKTQGDRVPRCVLFVHGDEASRVSMAHKTRKKFGPKGWRRIKLPKLKESFVLD